MSETQFMTNKAQIKEIFTSIQGEGPYIGVKQLFIRFCGCNLCCKYCDTDFGVSNSKIYTVDELVDIVNSHKDCHSVSLTGGEPLLHIDFLKQFLPEVNIPVYLETNATLANELKDIIKNIDYISADIKLPSCAGNKAYWSEHRKFFSVAKNKNLFAKVVFDENITDEEISETIKLANEYNIELILQPKTSGNNVLPDINFINGIFDKFLAKYNRVRLIPQVHKFLNVR